MSKPTTKPATLAELLDAMRLDHPSVMCTQHPDQWSTDPPTFGGEEPACTLGVWSWDETHLLVGRCADELEIVERERDYVLTAAQREELTERYNALANDDHKTHTGDHVYGGGVFAIFPWDAREQFLENGRCVIELSGFETKSGRPETFTVDASDVDWEIQ